MTSWRYRDSRWSERLNAPIDWNSKIAFVAVAAAVLVVVGAAVIFARGDSAKGIAADAQVLTWSESVASAGAALRGEVREGLVVGQAAAFGVFDEETTARSAARIREAIAELEQRVGLLADIADADGITTAAAVAGDQATNVAAALEAGDIDQALAIAEDQLSFTFEQLSAQATTLSQESAEDIAAVNAGLGTVSTAARFVAALIIPALAVLLFYRSLRRSQKVSLLRTELARERELRRNKNAFVAAASHHVRTPLSAVVSFTELLRDSSPDFSPAVRDEIIELIASEAEETSNVVDDLLAAARYEAGDLELAEERLEVRDVVDAVTSDWAKTQRAKLTIGGNAVIIADARWLGHALRNLLRTAAASGGEEIEVFIKSIGTRATVEISDDGAAIPLEENDRISELYYSFSEVDGLAPSLGLGLAVARWIAQATGGDLRYQRLEGKNVFEMILRGDKSHVLRPVPAGPGTLSPPKEMFSQVTDPTGGKPAAEAIEQLIAKGGPRIDYQPIVALSPDSPDAGEVVGFEAFARFPSHTPTDWFKAAARLGLRVDLELAYIRAAIKGFRHPVEEETFLAVNVSDETIHASQLADVIAAMAPRPLVLELAEAASITSYQRTRETLEELSAIGTSLAIDGVDSDGLNLDHIARLEPRIIKLGVSLVREARRSTRNRALIKAVAAMAGEFGGIMVVVGVETADDHNMLTELGVGFGQGRLYGRPAKLTKHKLARKTS